MALMDFIRGQFIDIIQWTDDSRDTLSYCFPDEDREIKNGAQRECQETPSATYRGKQIILVKPSSISSRRFGS